MTKTEFLKKLAKALSNLESNELQKSLSYYSEIIDDRIESGLTEEKAIAKMEGIPVIVEKILNESPVSTLKAKHHPLTVVFVIISFPLWGSVNLALLVIIGLLLGGGFIACLSFFAFILNEHAVAFIFLGLGLMSVGFGIFILFSLITLSKGIQYVWQNIDNRLFNRNGKVK